MNFKPSSGIGPKIVKSKKLAASMAEYLEGKTTKHLEYIKANYSFDPLNKEKLSLDTITKAFFYMRSQDEDRVLEQIQALKSLCSEVTRSPPSFLHYNATTNNVNPML